MSIPIILEEMDVIVERSWAPISYVIRVLSRSRWSHACVAGAKGSIYTTTAKGFAQVKAVDYLAHKTYAVFRMPGLKDISKEAGVWYCEQQLGKPYDYAGALALILNNFKGHGIQGYDNQANYCAEEVENTFGTMGYDLNPSLHRKSYEMLPEDCIDPRMKLIYTNDKEFLKKYIDTKVNVD